jgi:hypothetical protein
VAAIVGLAVGAEVAVRAAVGAAAAAAGDGFGVGVTRTWKPPQANMASSSIAAGSTIGQRIALAFIVASLALEARS